MIRWPVTVSIGSAQLAEHEPSIEEALHRANIALALYQAKRSGRNQAIPYSALADMQPSPI